MRALRQIRDIYASAGADDVHEWTPPLLAAISEEKKISVRALMFPNDDMLLARAWAVQAHEVESNVFRATTIKDQVNLAQSYRENAPG